MAPLRVVHVYKDVYPPVVGGIEKHIDALRRAMPGVESNVLVCARAPRTSTARLDTGLEVRVAEFGPRWLSVPLAPGLPRRLARIEADLVHVHMPNPAGEAAVLLSAGERPVVASFHADVVRQAAFMRLYRPLAERCLDRASAVVVGSQALLDTSPLLRGRSTQALVIPYAIDERAYRPDAVSADERSAVRARYGTPLVVATGRLVYYKGLEHLIAAARTLDASVVIAGTGPREKRLRELAASVANVRFTGEIPEAELVRLLAAADCFVLPSTSRAESFGIATLEAQAMGVPAVVTDVGTGTTEAIEPGKTGAVVRPGDPRALAEGIEDMLADESRRAAMGRAARERVLKRHTIGAAAERLERLYEEVVARRP